MKLCERVAVISKENIEKLSHLYGAMDIDDLSRIVNNHLEVAIDEIEEDSVQQACNNPDLIQMNTGIVLTDKDGNVIKVKTPKLEYVSEIFS